MNLWLRTTISNPRSYANLQGDVPVSNHLLCIKNILNKKTIFVIKVSLKSTSIHTFFAVTVKFI